MRMKDYLRHGDKDGSEHSRSTLNTMAEEMSRLVIEDYQEDILHHMEHIEVRIPRCYLVGPLLMPMHI